jgi:ornithine carbamoyltransferase
LKLSQDSGTKLLLTSDITLLGPQDALYTDTWISMGENTNVTDVLATFKPYQVNHKLMAKTGASIVMHCQPAHLEEEITTELFDSEMSVAFQSAQNRMWAQNAVLASLLSD